MGAASNPGEVFIKGISEPEGVQIGSHEGAVRHHQRKQLP